MVPDAVRWAALDGLRLTLKFLGSIDGARVEEITQGMHRACRESAPFRLTLSDLGVFPNENRPRVIWAGVQGDLDSVMKLQAGIETEMSALGLTPEKRPFTPHLTLGRVRGRVADAQRSLLGRTVSACSIGKAQYWLVETVRLVRSDIGLGSNLQRPCLGRFGRRDYWNSFIKAGGHGSGRIGAPASGSA